jgi:hypothetical protein
LYIGGHGKGLQGVSEKKQNIQLYNSMERVLQVARNKVLLFLPVTK